MIVWLLVGILVKGAEVYTKPLGAFMEEGRCQEIREYVLAQAPKPSINYDAVCIKTDEMGGS